MNYGQTIHYLYDKLPFFSRLGKKAYKADLKNTLALCHHLDNPQDKIKTIHVAGTNGKGSVSHMLASVFQNCGYKTGLYTSPHLKDFRERIKINGKMISKKFVIRFVAQTKNLSTIIQPSFFELTFVMALDYFAKEKVDIAIIETGLGGRLDSTNVIIPEVSVITNIGFDHMDILGDTLEKIAFEKAGIIKANVPAVIGESLPETRPVFVEKAGAVKASLIFADENYEAHLADHCDNSIEVILENKITRLKEKYKPDLGGFYQVRNLRTVIATLDLLKDSYYLDQRKIYLGLKKIRKLSHLHGRWEVIREKPKVVLDVAHNFDGMRLLVDQALQTVRQKLRIVFGMVKDKEIEKVLKVLPKNAVYYFTKANTPRALPENELQEKAIQFDLHGTTFPFVNEALKAAINEASEDDLILVCGSVFVVGEINIG